VFDFLTRFPPALVIPPGRYGAAGAGVIATRIEGLEIASLAAAPDRIEELRGRCRADFGLDLPAGPRRAAGEDVEFIGVGPGRWLALGGEGLEERLRSRLSPAAAICDQSDGLILFDLTGPRLRDTLAKGLAIDIDPSVFRPGDAATTAVALIGVTFWLLDEKPTFRFAVPRSYAPAFSRFLVASAAEFGCVVS